MKSVRRLVFLWNYLSWGGAQVYFLSIMKAAKRDWDILVILPCDSSPEIVRYLDELGVAYRFVDYSLDFAPAATLARKIRRQANRVMVEYRTFRELAKFDVSDTLFHIEIAPWQSVAFLTAMSLRGAKVFLTMHNFIGRAAAWRETLWKLRLQFVSRLPGINLFASNNDTKQKLKGWVSDRFWERIAVTFTAVDPLQIEQASSAPFDKGEMLERLGIDRAAFVVLCVGQFIDRKGRWDFLKAARLFAEDKSDVVFVWLMPQPPSNEDRERIRTFGLGDSFKLVLSEKVGKERIDILKFFRIADVFVLPSYVEGLPIALLEAMALGIASISTNVYAIPEAIKQLDTGILIEAGDSEALAKGIALLKDDERLRQRLATAGRQWVIEHFDEREVAQIAIEQYQRALDS